MLTVPISADAVRRPELVSVGSGAWVACDPAAGPDDPRRAVAYLECKDERVYLLWVRDSAGVCEFASIRAALDAIAERLAARAAQG
ncbi:hypothetical protein [Microbacterium atlanticum]|jgi:hypothetical protein|uniref:hypothetical protein n=1 Tax=Microbacterium atlanticum TaxID=2782168 RepID=UPI0018881D07|nr:hypothetical protein [Microbacterium atlanticum]